MSGRMRIALVMLMVMVPGLKAQETGEELSSTERAYIASRLYQATYQYFAHWGDAEGLNVDSAYRDYITEALASSDRRHFTLASQAFLVRLGNSHTQFQDRHWWTDAGGPHGYRVRYLGGNWTVTESQRDGLRPGDIIEQIDGMPMDDFFASRSRFLNASTERYRRRSLFYGWHRHHFPKIYTLTLKGGRSVVVDRTAKIPMAEPETEGRLLEGGNVAYIRIPSWNDKRFQQRAMELLREYISVPALIVDVRGNNGGSTPITFINALMERPWRWWTESTPMSFASFSYNAKLGRSGFAAFNRPSMLWSEDIQPADSLYKGTVVILTDEGTHSASEDFTQPFKDNGRATIVGSQTAGSTGQPYTEELWDGMSFRIGAKREHFPDGARFEGIGIEPDLLVVPTPDDLRRGSDPELEAALNYLRKN